MNKYFFFLLLLLPLVIGCTTEKTVTIKQVELEKLLCKNDDYNQDLIWILVHSSGLTQPEAVDHLKIISDRRFQEYQRRSKLFVEKSPTWNSGLSLADSLHILNVRLQFLILSMGESL